MRGWYILWWCIKLFFMQLNIDCSQNAFLHEIKTTLVQCSIKIQTVYTGYFDTVVFNLFCTIKLHHHQLNQTKTLLMTTNPNAEHMPLSSMTCKNHKVQALDPYPKSHIERTLCAQGGQTASATAHCTLSYLSTASTSYMLWSRHTSAHYQTARRQWMGHNISTPLTVYRLHWSLKFGFPTLEDSQTTATATSPQNFKEQRKEQVWGTFWFSILPTPLAARQHHKSTDLFTTVHKLPCVFHSAMDIEFSLSKHGYWDLSTQAFVLGQTPPFMGIIPRNARVLWQHHVKILE